MSKALLVGTNEDLKRSLETGQQGRASRLSVVSSDWQTIKKRPPTTRDADLLVLDLTAPDAYKARGIAELQRENSRILLVMPSETARSRPQALQRLLDLPTVDFVRPNADGDEVRQRARRLLQRQSPAAPKAAPPSNTLLSRLIAPELHDPANGRIHAGYIAKYLGVPLNDIATMLGVSSSRLHKTPSARSIQPTLLYFESIIESLKTLAGSKEAARFWLNLPAKQFRGITPFEFMREGKVYLVAHLLEDMMTGHPS